jgi:hypothetical protein
MKGGTLRTGCCGRYLDLKRDEVQEGGGMCIRRNFITCTLLLV